MKTVHYIILRNISDESDAYTYIIKPELKSENGRKDFKALVERYDSHSSRETMINEAKRALQNLQYRNERSMPFERFTQKLQRAIDDLELGGRPMHNDDIVDIIWPKILNNEIKEFVVALKVDQARKPRTYKEILQDIATEVPKLSPNSNFRRAAAEVAMSQNSKYTRDGPCPPTGVMANGKMYIGNYHGKNGSTTPLSHITQKFVRLEKQVLRLMGGTPVTTVGMAMASPIKGGNYARSGDN